MLPNSGGPECSVRTVELAFTAFGAICRAILSRRMRGELRRIFPELTAELNGRFKSATPVGCSLRIICWPDQPGHLSRHKSGCLLDWGLLARPRVPCEKSNRGCATPQSGCRTAQPTWHNRADYGWGRSGPAKWSKSPQRHSGRCSAPAIHPQADQAVSAGTVPIRQTDEMLPISPNQPSHCRLQARNHHQTRVADGAGFSIIKLRARLSKFTPAW